MTKILRIVLILVVLLAAYILFNTFTFSSRQLTETPVPEITVPMNAKEHLSEAIRIKTISNEDPAALDTAAFVKFREFISQTYPLADSLLDVTYINKYSIVLTWSGKNTSLKPVIFMGHLDVVPSAPENRALWDADPFGGEIRDGYIWGRGSLDDKISVIGNMEAVEHLLATGYTPDRTMIFCFGHDEELGGVNGAVAIVRHLREKGISAEYVIDEGFAITQGMVPGIERDVALIGTAEKGFVSLKLTVEMEGGHSSMPSQESVIDVLSRAIIKLKDNPFDPKISPPVKDFIKYAGPEMTFVQKMAFANPFLFSSFITRTYESTPSGNALVRTTTAPTIIQAGLKENVIPYKGTATVNFRVLPGSTTDDVLQRVERIINDERIRVEKGAFSSDPPPTTSPDSFGYRVLDKTIHQVFPEAVTVPNLVVGATDSRHYVSISPDILRFTPFHLNQENITSFHGVNERISVTDFENAIRFYVQLIKNSTKTVE